MLFRRNGTRTASVATRDSVYDHRGNVPTPHFLYVHYVNRRRPPYPTYFFDHGGPVQNIQQAVDDAVGQIQAPNGPAPLPLLPDGGVLWEEASYAVFVMTPSQGRLEKGNGVHIWHDRTGGNHSFFNGADLDDVRDCSAMYCINFRRNRHGRPLDPGERERFCWKVNHTHGFLKAILFKLGFFSHENSGTNLGP